MARHKGRTRRVSPGCTLDVLGGRNLGAMVGALGDRVGRKEGGATGRNRGAAGSGMAGRVETGYGQQKAPQGEPYGGEGESGLLVSRRSLLVH
jgi:hypothetical protein